MATKAVELPPAARCHLPAPQATTTREDLQHPSRADHPTPHFLQMGPRCHHEDQPTQDTTVDPRGLCFPQVHPAGAADPSTPARPTEVPLEVPQLAQLARPRPGPLTGLPMVHSTPPTKLDPPGPLPRDLGSGPTDRRCKDQLRDRWLLGGGKPTTFLWTVSSKLNHC